MSNHFTVPKTQLWILITARKYKTVGFDQLQALIYASYIIKGVILENPEIGGRVTIHWR
ncbi:hypothetical protein QKW35_08135 [Pontibacterium granulatum]|nr:hypothetical protein [Pontibacterium granulatum]